MYTETFSTFEQNNAEVLSMLDELRALVDRQSANTTGVVQTPVPSLNTARLNHSTDTDHCLERPLVSIILQGAKHMSCGIRETARDIYLTEGNSLLVAVDMPTTSTIIVDNKPFLASFVYLDKSTLLDLSIKMHTERQIQAPSMAMERDDLEGVAVDMVDPDLLSCMLRLARLWDKPEQISVRAPIILHELHYVILAGRYGHLLQNLYRRDSQNSSVVQAIALLKQDLASPLRVDELARRVNMSVSSLHRHFKQLTGQPPAVPQAAAPA